MATIEELNAKIVLLEQTIEELKNSTKHAPARSRIEEMSAEVVDANPYR